MLNDTWEKVGLVFIFIYARRLTRHQCLLVKGWKASSGWGFPKGKINQDEPEPTCAIREVISIHPSPWNQSYLSSL
jgi:8-oxo-dGTP pyrophosphatase MutT (NUDIX family)